MLTSGADYQSVPVTVMALTAVQAVELELPYWVLPSERRWIKKQVPDFDMEAAPNSVPLLDPWMLTMFGVLDAFECQYQRIWGSAAAIVA